MSYISSSLESKSGVHPLPPNQLEMWMILALLQIRSFKLVINQHKRDFKLLRWTNLKWGGLKFKVGCTHKPF